MTLIIPSASSRVSPVIYKDEAEFEKDIVDNYPLFFGDKTLFIPKSMIFGGIWNNTTPDGFLFDCRDGRNPRFYIIEVELSDHSFRGHMRDQIDNFLAFFKDEKDTNGIIDKVYDIVSRHDDLTSLWNDYCEGEMYRLMSNSIRHRHGVLVLFEKKNNELEENFDDYGKKVNPSWQQKVQRIFIQKYQNDDDVFFHQEGGIGHQDGSIVRNSKSRSASSGSRLPTTEEEHLRVCSPATRETYEKVKSMLLESVLEQNVVGSYIGFKDHNKRVRVSIYPRQKYLSFYVLHDDYKYFRDGENSDRCAQLNRDRHAQLKSMMTSYEVVSPNEGHYYFYLNVNEDGDMDELRAYIQPVLS